MKKIVTHKQIYQDNAFGGITNSTLCGRVNNHESDKNEGANVSEGFNCYFCKQIANSWGTKKIERSREIELKLKAN